MIDAGDKQGKLKMNFGQKMNVIINAKQLRASLPKVVQRVRKGQQFTVLYRSRPAFRIVPLDETSAPEIALREDSLYGAAPVGRCRDGQSAADHDKTMYGR